MLDSPSNPNTRTASAPTDAAERLRLHLRNGLARIQEGRFDDAETALRAALVIAPAEGEAFKLIGAARLQRGRWLDALMPTRRSVQLRGLVDDLGNYGVALQCARREGDALAVFRRAYLLRPDFHEALNNLGVSLRSMGRPQEASRAFQRALTVRRDYTDARNNLAGALAELNAGPVLSGGGPRMRTTDPLFAQFQKACQLGDERRWEEAAAAFRRVVTMRPDVIEAYDGLGNVLRNAGNFAGSLRVYRRALRMAPLQSHHAHNQARALLGLSRAAEAEALMRRQIALDPTDILAWNLLGMACNELRRWNEASQFLRHALRLDPLFADTHNNLGNTLLNLDRLEEAVGSYRTAVLSDPRAGVAWGNMGTALQRMNRVDEAIAFYKRAVAADPNYTRANFHRSMALLLKGNLKDGWEWYEWRKTIREAEKRQMPGPAWDGRSLAGSRIYLYTEQGFGDTFQMLRYVPLLAERGATVLLELPPPLMRLARSLPGNPILIEMGKPADPPAYYHVRCPLMSLPLFYGTHSVGQIPANVPYFSAPADQVRRWANVLGRDGRLKVGVVWSGNPAHGNDRARSMPSEHARTLFDGLSAGASAAADFILLQKDPRAAEEEWLMDSGRCRSLGPLLGDFADTAALLMSLDLLITVDTSVAHLAGGLGRPVWMMLPFAPDWRWLLDRDDTPWYPTMRLYRQPSTNDWPSVLARVRADFEAWVAERRG